MKEKVTIYDNINFGDNNTKKTSETKNLQYKINYYKGKIHEIIHKLLKVSNEKNWFQRKLLVEKIHKFNISLLQEECEYYNRRSFESVS